MSTVERVEAFSDLEVLDFFESFSQKILAGLDDNYSLEDAIAGVPNSIRNTDSFAQIEQLASEDISANLTPKDSAEIARKVLINFANDEKLERILEAALSEYKGYQKQGEPKILEVAKAVSMVLIAATITIHIEYDNIEIHKKEADPELVIPLIELVATLVQGK